MFKWYEQAEVCYAYLSDVPAASEDPHNVASAFRLSKWFTRGWTLQELLAPRYLDFFDKSWSWIGSKPSLDDLIRDMTGIDDLFDFKTASIAQKMSWAAWRETTRVEDQAYCLLGLFGVHMPPLYGEGRNAFIRLQLEIISKSDDDSILAWDGNRGGDNGHSGGGLLALTPKSFAGCSSIVRFAWDPLRPPHDMTSKGLCVHFPLMSGNMEHDNISVMNPFGEEFLAPLNCGIMQKDGRFHKNVMALSMYQHFGTQAWHRKERIHMIDPSEISKDRSIKRTMLYVPQTPTEDSSAYTTWSNEILMMVDSLSVIGFEVKDHFAKGLASWHVNDESYGDSLILKIVAFSAHPWKAAVIFANQSLQRIALAIGILKKRLWIDLLVLEAGESMEQILESAPMARQLLIGRDKISRPFLNGALNARLKRIKQQSSHSSHSSVLLATNTAVEVTFDPEGKLKWPVQKTPEHPDEMFGLSTSIGYNLYGY
jgi:hypothetical protein